MQAIASENSSTGQHFRLVVDNMQTILPFENKIKCMSNSWHQRHATLESLYTENGRT